MEPERRPREITTRVVRGRKTGPEDDCAASRVLVALRAFGAPLQDLRAADLTQADLVFQIGVPPLRTDVLTSIDGVSFDEAWPARFRTRFADVPANVLSLEHLVRNERATGRPQDLADVERLEGR